MARKAYELVRKFDGSGDHNAGIAPRHCAVLEMMNRMEGEFSPGDLYRMVRGELPGTRGSVRTTISGAIRAGLGVGIIRDGTDSVPGWFRGLEYVSGWLPQLRGSKHGQDCGASTCS